MLQSQLDSAGPGGAERTACIVQIVLDEAVRVGASDVHFEPTHTALEIRFRLDGVLQCAAVIGRELAPNVVARLKVMAELLTYRQDVPQEGRIAQGRDRFGVDMRVSTFPTIHGEKVAVRLFGVLGPVLEIDEIGLSKNTLDELKQLFLERNGSILLTGPSGSGKTTTLYACLRHLLRANGGGRHIVTIEDPVEQVLEGISQSQARPGAEFDFARGLRSLLRQDPEVLMIGEIRDPETAHVAIEAALTGHLVLSTLHAGSACGVLSRLLEMGLEPYLLTSGVKGILNQRLVRRLCPECKQQTPGGWVAVGCAECQDTGFAGRILLAELVRVDASLRDAILRRADTATLERCSRDAGRPTIWSCAEVAIAEGRTTMAEVVRVLGLAERG